MGEWRDADDAELTELFRAFDDVVASDDLKRRTIQAMQAERAGDTLVRPHVDASAPRSELKVVEGGRSERRSVRRPARRPARLRLVAAAAAVLVVFGALSWFVPVSSIRVASADYVVDLAVNVYGRTVSASATDDESKELLEKTDVRNLAEGEARERLQKAFRDLHPDQDAASTDGQVASAPEPAQQPLGEGSAPAEGVPAAPTDANAQAPADEPARLEGSEPQDTGERTQQLQELQPTQSAQPTEQTQPTQQETPKADEGTRQNQPEQQQQQQQQQRQSPAQDTRQQEQQPQQQETTQQEMPHQPEGGQGSEPAGGQAQEMGQTPQPQEMQGEHPGM